MAKQENTVILPISEYAVIVDPKDNVAVVKTEIAPETIIEMPDGRSVCVTNIVKPGHRFATRPIPAGAFVLQYGQPIGTSLGINEGDPISHANMSNEVPVVRELPETVYENPVSRWLRHKRSAMGW